ncbi:MAG TPA: hypothetical protein VK571_06375 [Gemmatimonadaceae bacterium]|nr:hypothetical protein [Gemmatimonadaceae bacterium]
MTATIDRAAEAPRILGQLTTPVPGDDWSWWRKCGPFTFELYRNQENGRCAAKAFLGSCYTRLLEGSEADCIAAIERELLKIRDAIPARAAEPPQPASVGGAGTADFAGDWSDMAGAGMNTPLAEPPHPSNEELIATVRARCLVVPFSGRVTTAEEAACAIDALDRRLAKGGA